MASVRLTQELKGTIKRAIQNDFREVREGHIISEETEEKVNEFARARLASAVEEQRSATSAIVAAADVEVRARGGVLTPHMDKQLRESVCSYVGNWDSFYVRAADPESEEGNTTTIYAASRPYTNLDTESRRVLGWAEAKNIDYTTDQALVDEILPNYLQLRALDKAERLAKEYAESMFQGCNTLAQLIRKWPDAVRYVPEHKLELMRDKTSHKIKEKVEEAPVAIMDMDEALRRINLQAEAVKALKQ